MQETYLSSLRPEVKVNVDLRLRKAAIRNIGSAQLNLLRASKLPSYSRRYFPGDPIHLIDWRAYARNDQLIVREVRDEANLRVRILVDIGETMNWPDENYPNYRATKQEIAWRIALHLAYAHMKKGDQVYFHVYKEQNFESILPLKYSDQIVQVYTQLSSKQFALTSIAELFRKSSQSNNFDLTYFISDCLSMPDIEQTKKNSKFFRLIHTLSSLEVDLDWLAENNCYFDEGYENKEFMGSSLKNGSDYSKALDSWSSKLRSKAGRKKQNYILVTEMTQISEYLTWLE